LIAVVFQDLVDWIGVSRTQNKEILAQADTSLSFAGTGFGRSTLQVAEGYLEPKSSKSQLPSSCQSHFCDASERQLQYIYDHTTQEYPGVGILTASNRDVWAKV
jgi:hypothetical protein